MKGMIAVDVTRCIGCHSCELACAVAHSAAKTLVGALSEDPRPKCRVHVEPIERSSVPMQCRHCSDAPCVTVCPSGALGRDSDDDPVLYSPRQCIGCNNCLTACPFGSITPGPAGRKIVKCDLCVDRLQAGEQPACCQACPCAALSFVPAEVAARQKRQAAAKRYLVTLESTQDTSAVT